MCMATHKRLYIYVLCRYLHVYLTNHTTTNLAAHVGGKEGEGRGHGELKPPKRLYRPPFSLTCSIALSKNPAIHVE